MSESDNLELLLIEIDMLKTELQLYGTQQNAEWLQTVAIENTYLSNRLEGVTFNLRETGMAIRSGLILHSKSMEENLAILNHYQAIQFILSRVSKQLLLSEDLLKQLHVVLSKRINRQHAGDYRTQVATQANDRPAADPEKLGPLMAEYFHWAHSEGQFLHPLIFAAETHLRFLTLKPFTTANGLCARLAMNLILLEEGYPLLSIAAENDDERSAYYAALANAQSDQDGNAWHCFIAKQARQCWQNLLQRLQYQEDAIE
ncbi:MAG: Fic family protein [Methylomonas sp.]|nr:Fic family protein [Methylomonas sp.]